MREFVNHIFIQGKQQSNNYKSDDDSLLTKYRTLQENQMQHFYDTIQGWSGGIIETYSKAIQEFESGSHFVEVGTWKGRSAAFMAVELINSGKHIRFDCVDSWVGAGDEEFYDNDHHVIHGSLYEHFVENMKPVHGKFNAVRKASLEAALEYPSESVDFIFIDASHDYENVLKDINAWYDKVKVGGVLAGHDYNHLPVKQAVDESFPAGVELITRQTWWVRKMA